MAINIHCVAYVSKTYLSEKLNPLVLLVTFVGIAVGGADFNVLSLLMNGSSERMFSEFLVPSLEPQSDETVRPDTFSPTPEECTELVDIWFVKLFNAPLLLMSECNKLISVVLDILR